MTSQEPLPLESLLGDAQSSVRLQAALTAGTYPNPRFVEPLVQRSAVEPDFYVRDMLTWALTRHPVDLVVPRLLEEVRSDVDQARSQSLHSLSKIGDPRGWAAITTQLLRDADDEVARSAWRAAVVLVPEDEKPALAETLATQLGRGGRDVQLSLSRALAALGDHALPALQRASGRDDAAVRTHARATEHLLHNPDDSYEAAIFEANRLSALMSAPTTD